MAKLDSYKCDICGGQRKDSNHWFLGIRAESTMAPGKYLGDPKDKIETTVVFGFAIVTWDNVAAAKSNVSHLCGIECALKWIGGKLTLLSK